MGGETLVARHVLNGRAERSANYRRDFARFWAAWYVLHPSMIGRSSRPLTVQLPPEGTDRPSWIKVGAIALIGFTVGVVWPRLAGIRPGPSAPGESSLSAGGASAGA